MGRLERVALHRLVAVALAAFALVALVCVIASPALAHDIPADVRINAFFKPAGNRAELLVRLPLASLIDTDFPTRADGSLDIARADEPIRGGIKVGSPTISTSTRTACGSQSPASSPTLVSLPSDKSFVSFDAGARPCAGAAAVQRSRPVLEPDIPRRAARISDRSPTIRSIPSTCGSTGSAAPSTPRCASCRRAGPCALSSSKVRPVSSISIRAGTRRCCASWRKASGTFSTAPTTCCSSPASSSRSAGCARSSLSSRRSRWRIRSRCSPRRSASRRMRCGSRR